VSELKFWKTGIILKQLSSLAYMAKLIGKTFAYGTENYFPLYLNAVGYYFLFLLFVPSVFGH